MLARCPASRTRASSPLGGPDAVVAFELTVTDDTGLTNTHRVPVEVVANGPPTTTVTITATDAGGVRTFDITLSSDEPGTTHFRVTGGGADTTAWQTYTGPLQVEQVQGETSTLEFYSIDDTGLTEATQTRVLE